MKKKIQTFLRQTRRWSDLLLRLIYTQCRFLRWRPYRVYTRFLLLLLILAIPFAFPEITVAGLKAPPSLTVPNPAVIFDKGLLTVDAKDVELQLLMDEISKKAGIAVSVSEGLKEEKVTIHFENMTLEAGLRAVLQGAKVVLSHPMVYYISLHK